MPATSILTSSPPIDDGSTITALIGAGADCHFTDIASWWAWMPTSLVAQNRSHIGLLDKTSEFTHSARLALDGKTTDSSHTILLMPRPGHAYYEHIDFWTGPLRYDPNRGVALLWDLAYNDAFLVSQDWMTVRGLQIQNKVGPYASGSAFAMTAPNSSLQLSIVYTPNINHTYGYNSIFAGNASKHFGNFFVCGSVNGVNLGSSKIQFENCSFIATSDSGAAAASVALAIWDDTVLKNCAFFGWKLPYGSGGNRAQVINCITDTTFPSPSGNPVVRGNIESATYADQIVNTAKATLDLRTKAGSKMYNAGETPSAWNNLAPGGARVKEGAVDIGAFEANRFTPSKFVITGNTTIVQELSANVRVALDVALVNAETQTVALSDGAGGTFEPASYTLTANEQFKVFVYTPTTVLGNRTVTATNTEGTYAIGTTTATYLVKAPEPATKLTTTTLASIALGESSTFTVSSDNPPIDDQVFNVALSSNISCLFEPASFSLTRTHREQEVKFTPNAVGSLTVTATPTGSLNLPALSSTVTVKPRPPTFVAGNNYYEVGIGHQFTNLKAFATWIADKDLVAMQANAYVQVFTSEISDAVIAPLASNQEFNIHYKPAPGMGYRDIATSSLYGYPNAGIELSATGLQLGFSLGSTVEGFRIKQDSDVSVIFTYNPGAGANAVASVGTFQRNRVLITRTGTTPALLAGERASSANFRDNVFIANKAGVVLSVRDGSGDVTGNTLVATGDAIGNTGFSTDLYGGNTGKYQNNVFWNCGNNPWSMAEANPNEERRITAANFNTNFTNVAIDAARPHAASGFTVNTAAAFFNDATAGDYRAAKNGPLYGTATALAISTNDAAGSNRGYSPDAGALQLEPANTLGVVTATSQKMSGNRLELEMSLLNTIDTLTVVLPADSANPAGAVQQGPYNVTVTGATGKVRVDGIPVGNYGKPIVEATNEGGSSYGTGFNAVKVSPIKTNASFDEYIGVANAVVCYGKPKLPIYAAGAGDKNANSPLIVDLIISQAYVTTASAVSFGLDLQTKRAISKVEIYLGATLLSTQTEAPFGYTIPLTAAMNGTYTPNVKVYDAYGGAPVSASGTLVIAIPQANATVPTVTAATAANGQVQLVFSEAMDVSKDYDFGTQANYHLTGHAVTGSSWQNATTLLLGVDSYYPLKQNETLKLSYRKNPATGWRSAAGVLVESFDDLAVTNNQVDAVSPNLTQTMAGLTAGTALASKTMTTGTAVWAATTLFTSDGAALVPGDASAGPRVNGAVLPPGTITANNTTYYQRGMAVSFTLASLNDSPYSIAISADKADAGGNSNTSFGSNHVRVELSKTGALSFTHVSTTRKPNTYPIRQLPALEANVEYTLRFGRTDENGGLLYAVQLWKSTNGVLNTLVGTASYLVNQLLDNNFYKIYTTDVAGPYAKVNSMTGVTSYWGGDRVPGDAAYTVPATMGNNDGAVVATDGNGFLQLTGNGGVGDEAAAVTLGRLFMTPTAASANDDAGFQVTIGTTVQDILIGTMVSSVKNNVGVPAAADQLFFAVKAPALGAPYEVVVANTNRLPNRQLAVVAGDVVRARSINGDVLLDVKRANGDVVVLYRVRWVAGRLSNYLTPQITLPGNSTVNNVKY